MTNILSEVFRCILYILGIVACFSLIVTLVKAPIEKKKREQIEKQKYEEAKEKFQEISKELGNAMKELLEDLAKEEEKKNTKTN